MPQLASNAFVVWHEELVTGIESVDQAHRKMVSLMNRLAQLHLEYGADEPPAAQVAATLSEFYAVVREHFAHEERLMQAAGCADLAEQRREHTMLVAELCAIVAEVKRGRARFDRPTLLALRQWLGAHNRHHACVFRGDRGDARTPARHQPGETTSSQSDTPESGVLHRSQKG